MFHAALILAAGKGSRIEDSTSDKTLANLAGKPVIAYSIEAFQASGCVTTFALVYRDDSQRQALQAALASLAEPPDDLVWVRGGEERQDSVLNGLRALPATCDCVFIHDAARPFIAPEAIRLLEEQVTKKGAACLARRVTDTIKQVRPAPDLSLDAFLLQTVDRSQLWAVETPQVFKHALILGAYENVRAAGLRITDDTAALEETGHPVALVESPSPNPKLTTSADIPYLEYLLSTRTNP